MCFGRSMHAATIGSQSAPGWRVTVTKSLTPKMVATPPAAKTAGGERFVGGLVGVGDVELSSSWVSSVNFIASGLGVEDGVAVATCLIVRPAGIAPWFATADVGTPRYDQEPGDETTMTNVLEAMHRAGSTRRSSSPMIPS